VAIFLSIRAKASYQVDKHQKGGAGFLHEFKTKVVTRKFLVLIFLLLSDPMIYAQLAKGRTKFLGNILSTAEPDENFATYWNQVTPEASGKFGLVEPTRGLMDWSVLDAMHRYARRNGFPFKEHNFIWGVEQPSWIDSLPADQQKLEIAKWIRLYGQRYPDTEFVDVVNEPIHQPPPYKEALGGDGQTGCDWVIWAFIAARRYCPHSKLLLNEYHLLSGGNDLEEFLVLLEILKWRKLVDGIGVQAHGLEQVSDATIQVSLDRLASSGLPIYISELDLNFANDDAQLKRYQALFPILWQNPAVKGVTLWGYKQNHIWQSDAYLLRANGTERPALAWLKKYLSQ
jgi:endo-1,4-beta-xylanase